MMIEVRDLSRYYNQHRALDNISFAVEAGEIVGLVGANGAGKTTLLRILAGSLTPTSGVVRVDGVDMTRDSIAARRIIGYQPELSPAYQNMSVRRYLNYWRRFYNAPVGNVDRVLQQVDLTDRASTLIRHLSKGMRQRLGLARALVHDPLLVILDEPTIGIDPIHIISLRRSIRALAPHHTVLISSHNLHDLIQICTRLIFLHRGRVIHQQVVDETTQTQELETRLMQWIDPELYIASGEGLPPATVDITDSRMDRS